MKIRYNLNDDVATAVKHAVEKNDGYCPCKIDKIPENLCMCQEFKNFVKAGNAGLCHCMLFESYS